MKKIVLFTLLFYVSTLYSQGTDSLISINNSIYKYGDTLKLRSFRTAKIQLRTINNLTSQEIRAVSRVMVSGSSDSLFSFIIPANLSNGVYKLRGINMNDSSKNSFVIESYTKSCVLDDG